MREAIEKLLKKFVFSDMDILDYEISKFLTLNVDIYEYVIKIQIPSQYSIDEINGLIKRLTEGMKMIGFEKVGATLHFNEKKKKFIVDAWGKIKTLT